MIFGRDLFLAEALEAELHIECAAEMSLLAQAIYVLNLPSAGVLEIALCPTGESGN